MSERNENAGTRVPVPQEDQWNSRKHQDRRVDLTESLKSTTSSFYRTCYKRTERRILPVTSPVLSRTIVLSEVQNPSLWHWDPGLGLCGLCSSSTLGSAFLSASLSSVRPWSAKVIKDLSCLWNKGSILHDVPDEWLYLTVSIFWFHTEPHFELHLSR